MEKYFQVVDLLMKGNRLITDEVTKVLKPYGITEPQYNVLRILFVEDHALTIQDIQAQMYHQSSNVSRIIDKLVAKDLVTRHVNPDNRRKMSIQLTPKGVQEVGQLDQHVHAFHQELNNKLTDDHLDELKVLLKKMFGGENE